MMVGSANGQGIYLVIQFDWPDNFKPEYGQAAKALHQHVVNSSWIEEVLAASGGIGAGPSSLWIFRIEDYGSLDRLLHAQDDPVSAAYNEFFSQMVDVEEIIREQVLFS
jgi:hypothetical protein